MVPPFMSAWRFVNSTDEIKLLRVTISGDTYQGNNPNSTKNKTRLKQFVR